MALDQSTIAQTLREQVVEVPHPNTDTLTLSAYPDTPDAIQTFVNWYQDPQITQHFYKRMQGIEPKKLSEILRGLMSSDQDAYYAVRYGDDQRIIGYTALGLLDLDTQRPAFNLGYLIDPCYQNNKYGQAVCSAMLYLGRRFGFSEARATVAEENRASVAILAKIFGTEPKPVDPLYLKVIVVEESKRRFLQYRRDLSDYRPLF